MEKMNVSFIINKIKLEQNIYSDSELASLFEVSASAVSNWKQREKMPLSVIQKYCHNNDKKIDDYLKVKNVEFLKTTSTNQTAKIKELDKMDMEYIVDLQKDKIDSQKSEIEHLKTLLNDNPLQNKQWSEIDADFCTDVEVTISAFSPKQRRITNMKGMSSIKHLLQLTDEDEKRIWRENDWFEYEEHPCNQIIEDESLKMLQKETKSMPSLLESLRLFIGNYYMCIPVIYNYNNQRVVTHCYIKIGWKLKPITIFTKNVILNGHS